MGWRLTSSHWTASNSGTVIRDPTGEVCLGGGPAMTGAENHLIFVAHDNPFATTGRACWWWARSHTTPTAAPTAPDQLSLEGEAALSVVGYTKDWAPRVLFERCPPLSC